jgi:NitT/TauT family transport system substrate-binding protein
VGQGETAFDFAGKTVGNWGFGNEYEVFAGLAQAGLDPATDVTLVQQDFNMDGLLSGDIDAAEAMIYNEYAQVLETVNPDTGELYQPSDLNVISYEEDGVGMLQDAIWADGERLANDDAYRDIAVRLLTASMQGWAYCRDNVQACTDLVVAQGSKLGASHQLWQMNEINQLIWPAPDGVGVISQDAWDRTVEIAQNTPNLEGTTVLTAPPDADAFTNDIINEALTKLQDLGVDTTGDSYQPIEVTLKEGGA